MAAAAYSGANLTGGLLSDVMGGLVPGFSGGLLDPNAQPARAAPAPSVPADAAPSPQAVPTPSAPADATMAAPQAPIDADQIAQLIARNRPSRLQTLLHAWGSGQDFNTAQADLTKRNIAAALYPQQLALQQQRIAYGQSIKDSVMRDLFFNDPQTYGKVMADRMGVHDTAAGATTTGLGASGNGVVYGSQVLKPGETLSNAGGANLGTIPQAPFTVGAGDSVFVPGKGFVQAPQKGEVVKTAPGETASWYQPGLPGAGGQIGQTDQTGGAPQPAGGTAPNPAGASRGMRNNNPWNVTPLPKGQWAGQTGTDGDFAQFETPQAGARAADINLKNYAQLDGVNTLRGIISRWAPKWQTETPTYVQAVSDATGFKPDQPLDIATNSATRAKVLHAMLPIEAGRAGAAQAEGQAPTAPSGASPSQGGNTAPDSAQVRPIQQGAMPRDVPAQEAIAKGLAPGKWQQLPNGDYKLASPPPKGDVERVQSLLKTAEMYDNLENYDQEFMKVAKRYNPGWGYQEKVLGFIPNPYADWAENNTPVAQMHDLHNKELFVQKPDNAGQRILASEIPLWGTAAVDPGKSIEANRSLIEQHRVEGEQIKTKSQFYNNWLYEHGNLNGADAAWQDSKKARQRASSAPQRPQVTLPARAPALPSNGFAIVQ